jgi:hypothetical protein
MGLNNSGQLGSAGGNTPEQIVASNVTAIAVGKLDVEAPTCYSLFFKHDGSLWGMGDNSFGELGSAGGSFPEQIVAGNVTAIAAGFGHSLFLKSDGSMWGMGYNLYGQLGDGTYNYSTNLPEQILGPYNQIQTTGQLVDGTNMQLNFVGVANANYALDWSSSLSPPNWIPQLTNPASSFGPLVFTNPPDATTNNFWRIRSVP